MAYYVQWVSFDDVDRLQSAKRRVGTHKKINPLEITGDVESQRFKKIYTVVIILVATTYSKV